jgi:hypothetical protein
MNPPTIKEVTFLPLRVSEKGLIGISSMLFDDRLCLNSISVYSTPTGDIRLLFPISALRNGKQINTYYPINKETYTVMREAVSKKIDEVTEKVKKG